jgi:ATP-dependent DNA helicase RecG
MFDPAEKVLELISLPSEDEVTEFKEANNDYDLKQLGRYFSALSNEANLRGVEYGWLVFGVRDKDRAFVDTKYRLDGPRLQSLKSEVGRKTTSGITFVDIYAFEIEPGKRVILFKIPAAPTGVPIAWEGHYYARDHESLVPLNIEKIERIRMQNNRRDWSKDLCDGASIDDLSQEAIARARELYKGKNPTLVKQVDEWDDVTFLNKAKITINGSITKAAIILLGKPESTHFISPAVSKISWILRSKDGIELDYEHFTSPLILSVDQLYSKIRNLKYRYFQEGSLFPEEVYQYEPYVIREALNNCIAHQDYSLGGKINVVENDEESLVFSNLGSFLPVKVENVINSDSPSEFYRNRFLSDAMVNLNMIDTIGSGIRKMFISQRKKFFPLPDYDLADNQVTVSIIGKVLDLNYARKLAQIPNLDLDTIILLDKVQKKKALTAEEAKTLRNMGLIEGVRPNLYVSSKVASSTDLKSDYMKRKGIDDKYYKVMITEYLTKFGSATRSDFEDMLIEKLPDNLSDEQKKNKIKNILQNLKKDKKIKVSEKREWSLDEI